MVSIFVLPFSIIGFLVSWYIYHKKHRANEKMVCILGSDCDRVVHSNYNNILGIPLEVLGVLYYLFLSLLVIATQIGNFAIFGFMIFDVVLVISSAAFIVSLFLIYVQARILREWCTYCLISAAMSIAIFLVEVL